MVQKQYKIRGGILNIYEEALKFHEEKRGKLEVTSRVKIQNEKDLSLAYTPGVAEPCREIYKDATKANKIGRAHV